MAAAEAIEETLGSLSGLSATTGAPSPGWSGSSTSDGFGAEFVTPALVRLQQQNPQLNVEMLSATRKVSQNRSGVDLEIVVGRTDVSNAQTIFLSNYFLRLYASPSYAAEHGLPETLDDVGQHGFVSYVESALQVAELGHRWSSQLPMPTSSFQATSVFAQVEAVRRAQASGCCRTSWWLDSPDFVPVLADDFERQLPIWAVARPESLRSAAVQAVVALAQGGSEGTGRAAGGLKRR